MIGYLKWIRRIYNMLKKKLFLFSFLVVATSMYGAEQQQKAIDNIRESITSRENLSLIANGLESLKGCMNSNEQAEFDTYKINIKKLIGSLPMLKENLDEYEKMGNKEKLCRALFVVTGEYKEVVELAHEISFFSDQFKKRLGCVEFSA